MNKIYLTFVMALIVVMIGCGNEKKAQGETVAVAAADTVSVTDTALETISADIAEKVLDPRLINAPNEFWGGYGSRTLYSIVFQSDGSFVYVETYGYGRDCEHDNDEECGTRTTEENGRWYTGGGKITLMYTSKRHGEENITLPYSIDEDVLRIENIFAWCDWCDFERITNTGKDSTARG